MESIIFSLSLRTNFKLTSVTLKRSGSVGGTKPDTSSGSLGGPKATSFGPK